MNSQEWFKAGLQVLPGGVNSPVRAFGAVGGSPLFIQSAQGATLTDVEGRSYTDYVGSWGPMILGHNHEEIKRATTAAIDRGLSFGAPCPGEVVLGQLLCRLAQIDRVRMVNSGTEATMSALRVARGATGRNKMIKFQGCYHGHSDSFLIKAGSGALTGGVPSSAGVPPGVAEDTLNGAYNNLESVEELFKEHPKDIACVIVEPVAANMGVIPPKEGFLQGLRNLCTEYGALLIFDEVITGFRLALGGAQEYYGVKPDLVTYGKIIGGGLPVGAYGGRKELMELVAPLGPVYQAGTLSGNPVAMAAGLAQLNHLEAHHKELYPQLEEGGKMLAEGLRQGAQKAGVPLWVNQVGSLVCPFFTDEEVTGFKGAMTSDTDSYSRYFRGMLQEGVYLAPAQFEAMFVSTAHTKEIIRDTTIKAEKVLAQGL